MNIVFLGGSDWANTSNRICRAINAYGGEHIARCVTKHRHPFGYEEDLVIDRDGDEGVAAIVSTADWIIGVGDADYDLMLEMVSKYGGFPGRGTRYGIRHSGTAIRSNPNDCYIQDMQFARVFVPMDIYQSYAHESRYRPFVQPQMTIRDKPNMPGVADPLLVTHTPSERGTKGTHEVMQAANNLDCSLAYLTMYENLPYDVCRQMRARHHVYIDGVESRYGNFGAAACEAMADGLVVLGDTHKATSNEYIEAPPIIQVTDRESIVSAVHRLARDRFALKKWQEAGLKWARQWTSINATYRYWDTCLA